MPNFRSFQVITLIAWVSVASLHADEVIRIMAANITSGNYLNFTGSLPRTFYRVRISR